MPADYRMAILSLQENLRLLSDAHGHIEPEDQPVWNVSNALIVICDALSDIQTQLTKIERQLLRKSE